MTKAEKLKAWFKKISIETYKYPDWKDICREELLKDFDFESKDDEKLKVLKQQFRLVKTKFFGKYFQVHPLCFVLRLYNLFIFSFVFYPFMSLFTSGDVIRDQGQGHPSYLLLILFPVSFIFMRFVYKYPFAVFNRFNHHGDLRYNLQNIITEVKAVKEIKLMNQNLFVDGPSEKFFPFFYFFIDFISIIWCLHYFLGLEEFTLNFLNEPKGLYILAQICLVILPSFFKWRYLSFSFKALFNREQIETKYN